jgi:hypothetical protein
MSFLLLPPWAAWLLIAVAAAAAGALFAIRPRPARRTVASLVIWQRVLDDAEARPWRERLRWLVSLALTLAIATAIAAAIARPAPGTGAAQPGDRLLLVHDSSWTMGARTASGDTRWDRAVAAARQLAAAWRGGDIAVATTAEGVVQGPTSDRALVERTIARLKPAGGDAAGWPHVAGATAVHFLTDGALTRALPSGVVTHSVFRPAPNVAIAAFDVQPGARPGAPASLFLAVANHAREPQAVRVAIARGSDVLLSRIIDIGAGEIHRETLAVAPAGEPRFRAEVGAPMNALAADDEAAAWLWTAAALRVTVVGARSPLASLLAHDANLRVETAGPADYGHARADVWVFDGWLPDSPPAEPALVVDPPASAWLGRRGPEEPAPVFAPAGTHPVLDGVDTALVQVARARAVVEPALRPIALSEQQTPLIAIEDSRARRLVVFAFAIGDSNLAATPAFPVLVGNAIDWLGRPASDLHQLPGRTSLPAGTVRVLGPDGRPVPFARLGDRVTATLQAPGLYLVQSAGSQRVLRVTLGDMRRSNLLVSSLAESPASPTQAAPRRLAWWIAAALTALVLISLEWITWQRRITV